MDALEALTRHGVLAARSESTDNSGPVINAMIALLSLVFFGTLLFAILVLIRRMRRQQKMRTELLPQYHDAVAPSSSKNTRRLTITTNDGRRSVLVFSGGEQPMLANPSSPPHSPDNVPEIHITFPDEQDEQGRRVKGGRVVVVRLGDGSTVGMEPLREGDDEPLPAYEKESKTQFYSIDMDRIGGLKEKDSSAFR